MLPASCIVSYDTTHCRRLASTEHGRAADMQTVALLTRQLQAGEEMQRTLKSDIQTLETSNLELHGQMATAQAAAEQASSTLSMLQLQTEALAADEAMAQEQRTAAEALVTELRGQLSIATDRCAGLEAALRASSDSGMCQLEMVREQLDNALGELSTYQSATREAQEQLKHSEKAVADLKHACAQLTDSMQKLRDQLVEERCRVVERDETIRALEEQVTGMEAEQQILQSEMQKQEESVQTLQHQLEEETEIHEQQVLVYPPLCQILLCSSRLCPVLTDMLRFVCVSSRLMQELEMLPHSPILYCYSLHRCQKFCRICG